MNQFEVLADNEPAMNESEVFRFSSLVPDARITLHEKKEDSEEYERFDPERYPSNVSLLACSSKFGYYVAATLQDFNLIDPNLNPLIIGFVYGLTKDLRDTIKALEKGSTGALNDKINVPISQGPVHQLRTTADQTQIVVVVAGGLVLIYNAKDIAEQKENVTPTQTFQLENDIIDIRPNPDALPELAAVVLKDNKCILINLSTGTTTTEISNDATAVCWSPKGKQLVCGCKDGQLVPYDVEGVEKIAIALPEELQAKQPIPYVLGVLWIQPHVFLVVYGKSEGSEEFDPSHVAYIIDRKSKSTGGLQYVLLDDITGVFSDERGLKMFMEVIPNFSSDMKYAVMLGNAASTDLSVVGQDENGDWATYILPENGLAMMPLSDGDMDTYPVGLALDFSVSEELPPYDSSVSNEGVKPMPALYYLNDEDHIGAYYCYQETLAKNGDKFVGMVAAEDIQTGAIAQPSSSSTTTTAVAQEPTEAQKPTDTAKPSGFGSSPFGAALSQGEKKDEAFASLLSGGGSASSSTSTASTSGMGAFGGSGSGGFTSFRNLGVSTSASPKPPSGFGSSTPGAPAFGSTSFGQASGDAPTQQQSFASLAKNTTPSAVSPNTSGGFFGSSSTTASSFGATAFGSAPTFGSSSFGSKPAFGSTGFGTAQPATTSSTPTTGTTSESAKQSQPGAFGAAFGHTTTSSGFGSGGFDQSTFGSALASSTSSSTTSGGGGGFASLGRQPNAPSKIPVPSSGGFGGASPFGKSTFGSTTPFGSTPPSDKPDTLASTSSPDKTTEPTPAPTPSESETQVKAEVSIKEEPSPATATKETASTEPALVKEEPKEEEKKTASLSFGSFGSFGSATQKDKPSSTSFGFGSFGSTLPSTTTTTTDGEPKKEEEGEKKPASSFGFSSFGSALSSTTTTATPTAAAAPSTPPKTTIGFGSFSSTTTDTTKVAPATGFFSKPAGTPPPSSAESVKPSGSLFTGLSKPSSSTTETKPMASSTISFPGISVSSPTPAKPESSGFSLGGSSTATLPSSSIPSLLSKPTESTPAVPKPSSSTTPITLPSLSSTTTESLKSSISSASPKKSSFVPEIPELTGKDSMAREFELAYHNMNNELKKLALRQEDFAKEVQQQQKQHPSAKSMRDLDEPLESWRIADVNDIGAIVDKILSQANGILPQINELSKSVEYFQNDLEKLEAKKNVIEEMKDKDKDPKLQKELDKRELDPETAKKWERVQSRAKEYGELLSDLENKVHDSKKRNKSPATSAFDANFPSLYSLHVALRDIADTLRSKQDQLQGIESQLARLQFKETHTKARKSSGRIALDDSSDEEEEEEEEQEKERQHEKKNEKFKVKTEKSWSQTSCEYTANYLRRERFLDKLHQFQQYQE
ncbi:hypothetical protein BDA99DRAFT_597940 [Phascolomyces articulosus]|uniref:Nucleoporin Nup159/Nup146 N-terminal domain-containing protein n=1 Tax=Phascolomyces articulosus TaxID=60185 RepID=A0AAD5K3Q9_9FUNG|nr:hypothetical protein BDA99DRAFT_597940 [Phascolomyces articulosus]